MFDIAVAVKRPTVIGLEGDRSKVVAGPKTLALLLGREESDIGCSAGAADEPRELARMNCPPGLLVKIAH
jgi:hypothetical protein